MGLAESTGKEDLVELDSSLTLIHQVLDCSPTNRERELGLDRRETGLEAERCAVAVCRPAVGGLAQRTRVLAKLVARMSLRMYSFKVGIVRSLAGQPVSLVGKGQPHIVNGKLEQGGSVAPLLARDTKTMLGGFAYDKEIVKIRPVVDQPRFLARRKPAPTVPRTS
ncbi:hypothetical protein Tco_0784074 [Tanacetum coccineum]